MKLDESNITTEAVGIKQEHVFGIGNIGMVLEILRHKMYQDPVLAIVREVASNARDAHREVGKGEVPIEIHLPNAFEPTLKIRDFGPGISDDRMANIFVQYANSTKRNDNVQTGGFGLGAKTPFSYADTFTVVTVVDGQKKTYFAYIDETKMGKMSLAKTEKTDESNGTTIVVPVKTEDFRNFGLATIKATCFWDVRPVIKGDTNIKYPKLIPKLNMDNLVTYDDTFDYSEVWPKAIIDGIQYPLNFQSLNNTLKDFSKYARWFQTRGFAFKFNNGDLSLSANRDTLHYDKKTCEKILDNINKINDNLLDKLNKDIEQSKTYFEAWEVWQNYVNSFPFLDWGRDGKFKWNELELRSFSSNSMAGLPGIKSELNFDQRYGSPKSYRSSYYSQDLVVRKSAGKFVKNTKVKLWYTEHVVKQNALMSWLDENMTKDEHITIFQIDPKERTNLLKYFDLLGGEDFDLLDLNLPKITTKRFKKQIKTNIAAYEFYPHTSLAEFKTVEIEDKGGVYVIVDRDSSTVDLGKNLTLLFKQPANILLALADPNTKIYGFTKLRSEKLSKDWKLLSEDLLSKNQDLDKMSKEIYQTLLNSYYTSEHIFANLLELGNEVGQNNFIKRANELLSKDSIFLQYLQESAKILALVKDPQFKKSFSVLEVCKKLPTGCSAKQWGKAHDSWLTSKKSESTEFTKLVKKVCKTYPLLTYIRSNHNDRFELDAIYNLDMTFDYIKGIDKTLITTQMSIPAVKK